MTDHYHSYLLRLWRNHDKAPWRLSLQHTATGKTESFSGPAALLLYLLAVMERIEEIQEFSIQSNDQDNSEANTLP